MNNTYIDSKTGPLSYLILMSIQGPIGNILIIVSVALNKQLRSCTDAFIVNVAVMDLIASGVLFPVAIPLYLLDRNIYNDTLCQMFGFLTTMLAIDSLASLTVVAVNRYILICKNHYYKKVFRVRNMAFMLFGCWFYGFLITLPSLFGWSGVGYRPYSATCAYNHNKNFSHLLFMFLSTLMTPMIITYTSYALIAYEVYKSKQRVAAHGSKKSNHGNMMAMFVVSAVFTLFWFPYALVVLWDSFQPVPPNVYMAAMWLGMSNSCVNFIVLGIANKKYRAAYKTVLCRCCSSEKDNTVHTIQTVSK